MRRGLRMLTQASDAFDKFATALGHDMYFIAPLYFHNAVILNGTNLRIKYAND